MQHAALANARKACFPGVPWHRCWFHLMRNALDHVPPEEMKQEYADRGEKSTQHTSRHKKGVLLR
jgi:transposase-like protein